MYGIAQYIRTTLVCLIWHFQATKTGGIIQKKLLWWFAWNELYAFYRLYITTEYGFECSRPGK